MHRGRFPKLHFVLEAGHKNAGDASRIFNETKAELTAKGCDMFGDILFAEKDESDPLMMADFLAHTTFLMGSDGGRAPAHWDEPTNVQRPPMTPGHSGITHLRFKPGGMRELKSVLIDRLKAGSVSARLPS